LVFTIGSGQDRLRAFSSLSKFMILFSLGVID